jgi:hypothetical protein
MVILYMESMYMATISDDLLRRPAVAVLMPQPHRRREVLDADGHADQAPGLGRVVGRPQLQHDLVLVAQVDALGEGALGHAPEVQVVAELAAEQVLGVEARLEHRRSAPLGGDHGVVVEVPPAVVAEELVAPVVFPGADHVEAVVVEQGDPARPVVAVGPPSADMKMPPGPQWTVWGRE